MSTLKGEKMEKSRYNQKEQSDMFTELVASRHSVRNYETDYNLSRNELEEILKQASLAPSGGNLQAFRFFVFDTPQLKEQLLPIAYHQKQITESSAVILVLGDLKCYEMADKIYSDAVTAGYISKEIAKTYIDRYSKLYSGMSMDELKQTICLDCGLASMQLMLSAKSKGLDTVPMTGFDKAKLSETFHISDQYLPVLLIAIGKAASPAHPTTRLSLEELAFFGEMPAK